MTVVSFQDVKYVIVSQSHVLPIGMHMLMTCAPWLGYSEVSVRTVLPECEV